MEMERMSVMRELTQEEIRDFVIPAHGDLAKVKTMLADNPALLNAMYREWKETALLAASHVGNREIAEYLLAQGAPMHVCTAAMLGLHDRVAEYLESDPALANARGAHDIPILFHAAMSGDTAVADLLMEHGGGEGLKNALHGAVMFGHLDMVRWLLERGADVTVKDFRGKTPLQVAAESGFSELADLLRQHGATG
jgi:ankyrin repeat protein